MPGAKQPARIPPALLGAGVLVVALGLGLPALVPGPAAPAEPPRPAPPAPEPAPVTADARPPAPPAPVQNTPASIGIALVRLAAALAVVCVLCVLAARWLHHKPPVPGESAMTVVASLRVGRCAVHLVRAGDRRVLIGTDATGVKSLVELPGPEPDAEPLPPERDRPTPDAHTGSR